MHKFILILLNGTTYSNDISDVIHICNSTIYSNMKYYSKRFSKEMLMDDTIAISKTIINHCHVSKYSEAISKEFDQTIIYPHNDKDLIHAITLYKNSTDSKYETFSPERHTVCMIKTQYLYTWITNSIDPMYNYICTYNAPTRSCVNVDSIKNTTYHITVNIQILNQTFCVNSTERLDLNILDVIVYSNRLIKENTWLRKENNQLSSALQIAQEKILDLVEQHKTLSTAKLALENKIVLLELQVKQYEQSNKALQIQLNDTTRMLKKANDSLESVTSLLEEIKDSTISATDDERTILTARRANYTETVRSYAEALQSMGKKLADQELITQQYQQDRDKLEQIVQEQSAQIFLLSTLLNSTLDRVDSLEIRDMINISQPLTLLSQSKRCIDDQYNEISDNDESIGDYFAVRIANAEQKIKALILILESDEKAILMYSQNEEQEIDDVQSNNQDEIDFKTSDVTTAVQEVNNRQIINKVKYTNADTQDDLVKSMKGHYADDADHDILSDGQSSSVTLEDSINYNLGQEIFMTKYETTTDYYDALVKSARDHADHIRRHMQQQSNDRNTLPDVLPDRHSQVIDNYNSEAYFYHNVTIGGGIALGAVVLHLINKYCFVISKWPIMAYNYITRSAGMSDKDINDSGTELSNVVSNNVAEDDEYDPNEALLSNVVSNNVAELSNVVSNNVAEDDEYDPNDPIYSVPRVHTASLIFPTTHIYDNLPTTHIYDNDINTIGKDSALHS